MCDSCADNAKKACVYDRVKVFKLGCLLDVLSKFLIQNLNLLLFTPTLRFNSVNFLNNKNKNFTGFPQSLCAL